MPPYVVGPRASRSRRYETDVLAELERHLARSRHLEHPGEVRLRSGLGVVVPARPALDVVRVRPSRWDRDVVDPRTRRVEAVVDGVGVRKVTVSPQSAVTVAGCGPCAVSDTDTSAASANRTRKARRRRAPRVIAEPPSSPLLFIGCDTAGVHSQANHGRPRRCDVQRHRSPGRGRRSPNLRRLLGNGHAGSSAPTRTR